MRSQIAGLKPILKLFHHLMRFLTISTLLTVLTFKLTRFANKSELLELSQTSKF